MTADDWVKLGFAGNGIAQSWYVLSHPGSSMPAPAPGGEITIPGVARASFNTNLLILGLIVGAVFIFSK